MVFLSQMACLTFGLRNTARYASSPAGSIRERPATILSKGCYGLARQMPSISVILTKSANDLVPIFFIM